MDSIMTDLLTNNLTSAPKDAALLILIWFMLKDVRSKVTALTASVATIKENLAPITVHLENLKDRHRELKEDTQKDLAETRDRIVIIEKELKAVWRVIGNRPEDRDAA